MGINDVHLYHGRIGLKGNINIDTQSAFLSWKTTNSDFDDPKFKFCWNAGVVNSIQL